MIFQGKEEEAHKEVAHTYKLLSGRINEAEQLQDEIQFMPDKNVQLVHAINIEQDRGKSYIGPVLITQFINYSNGALPYVQLWNIRKISLSKLQYINQLLQTLTLAVGNLLILYQNQVAHYKFL